MGAGRGAAAEAALLHNCYRADQGLGHTSNLTIVGGVDSAGGEEQRGNQEEPHGWRSGGGRGGQRR